VLGEKLHRDAKGDVKQMVTQGFLACLSREPDAKEMEILQLLHAEQLAHFRQRPAEAESLLKEGNAKRDATIPAPEAAAATVLAQTLMNHDASVVKR
jgi:phosphatidylserine/phosphatidylglycerophosphate/cardiolipin synthase-like enzyme